MDVFLPSGFVSIFCFSEVLSFVFLREMSLYVAERFGSVLLSMRGRWRRAIEWGKLDVSDVNLRSTLAGVLILRSNGSLYTL
jgi:hypothetical protein